MENQKHFSVGQRISHHEIVSLLGEGGMGEVYLAEDKKLGRKVAIKVLPHFFATDPVRLRRFQQEAHAASALNHPNICVIYEIGDTGDGRPFISMEYIDGVTLREKIHFERTDLKKLLRYLQHVGEALAKAHAGGIVHRDLKPDNIMITRDGHAKIVDFGLAKLTEQSKVTGLSAEEMSAMPTAMMPQRSVPGTVIGTIGYMSPEQAQGNTKEIDQRSDIFSFGCILFEAATRHRPFEGQDTLDSLHKIVHAPTPHIKNFNAEAPDELQKIVGRCLAKDPEERYQSIKDVAIELKDLRRELEREATDSTPMPSAATETNRRPGEAPHVQTLGATSGIPPTSIARRASSAEYIISEVKTHQRGIAIGLVAIVLLSAASLAYYFYTARTGVRAPIDSIAVLPLSNTANDRNTEYLSDGITESIISNLSQLPQLKVMARSTVFHFKGKEIDPRDVGRQLGVRAVMSGRLLQQGDHLIVRAELVNVADGAQLWGAEYDRKLSDVLALQQEISREISENLRLKLTGEEKKRLAGRDTNNAEAYQLYLLGRFHWSKFTEEGARKSIDYFNQALAKDPSYALAYHGLSDAYQLLGQIGFRPNEVLPKALVYADKALAADPTLPEAHLSRGACELWYGWNWTMAEQELKRAMELNPNLPDPHDLYGQFLSGMGRFDEAIAENKRALQLDPLSRIRNSNLAGVYYSARQYDLAIGQSRKVMELDTNLFFGLLIIGQAYGQQGKYPEAIAELIKARDLPGGFAQATSELGYIYAVSGRRTEAQKVLQELQERTKREFIDPYYIAIIYVGLGEQDETFAWLNKAYEERSLWLLWLRVEPKLDGLRADPRYQDLVRRMNFSS